MTNRRLLGLGILAVLIVATVAYGNMGKVQPADVAPTGQVWFGQSFDTNTFALTGKRTTVGTAEPLAMVAHLSKSVTGDVTVRQSRDGTLVSSTPVSVTGSGDVFGTTLGAFVLPGQYRYDVVDLGGNVLASGTVTAQ